MHKSLPLFAFSVALLGALPVAASPATDQVIANLRVPDGFRIEVFAEDVPGARSMALGQQGTLFVGTMKDKVYALSGTPGSETKPTVRVIAEKLNMPNGVAFRDGALYVAEISRILRYDGIESSLDKIEPPKTVREDLPKDRHHGWKYIAFGPDGKLYVPIGSPCNVCNEPRYASITRMNADGSGHEVFARGVRNTVGFTWHPITKQLWFTDNGRDYLGDDVPPCELNVAPRAGLDFGFPYCHGKDIKDPEFERLGDCSKMTPPAQLLGAHVAPLGVKFYTGSSFPEVYRNQIFIAEHGSWNRSTKNGYRISRVKLDGTRPIAYEPFVVGFKRGEEVLGRPVDLLVLEDGSMLISDDQAGAIYRVTYGEEKGMGDSG
jgi:glucose/arabinose dehydrogenase